MGRHEGDDDQTLSFMTWADDENPRAAKQVTWSLILCMGIAASGLLGGWWISASGAAASPVKIQGCLTPSVVEVTTGGPTIYRPRPRPAHTRYVVRYIPRYRAYAVPGPTRTIRVTRTPRAKPGPTVTVIVTAPGPTVTVTRTP